jgi:hypothetical protein
MKAKQASSGPDRRTISHQLREAVLADGRTAYALGQAAGIDPGVIQRFLNQERGLTLDTVDRLALALNLRLLEVARSTGRGRPRKTASGSAGQILKDEAMVESPGNPDNQYD